MSFEKKRKRVVAIFSFIMISLALFNLAIMIEIQEDKILLTLHANLMLIGLLAFMYFGELINKYYLRKEEESKINKLIE